MDEPALLVTLSAVRELTFPLSLSHSLNLSVNRVQPVLIQMLTSRACLSDANTKANRLYIMNHHVQAPTQTRLPGCKPYFSSSMAPCNVFPPPLHISYLYLLNSVLGCITIFQNRKYIPMSIIEYFPRRQSNGKRYRCISQMFKSKGSLIRTGSRNLDSSWLTAGRSRGPPTKPVYIFPPWSFDHTLFFSLPQIQTHHNPTEFPP